jgi:hypothetical protein
LPQHWNRDRWFLPTPKRTAKHLQALAADGGRACEYQCLGHLADFTHLRPDALHPDKINLIVRCLENAYKDLDHVTMNAPA